MVLLWVVIDKLDLWSKQTLCGQYHYVVMFFYSLKLSELIEEIPPQDCELSDTHKMTLAFRDEHTQITTANRRPYFHCVPVVLLLKLADLYLGLYNRTLWTSGALGQVQLSMEQQIGFIQHM